MGEAGQAAGHVDSTGSAHSSGAHASAPSAGDGDGCFDIDLDGEPPDRNATGAEDLRQALDCLNGGTPDTILEGLQLVGQHLASESWRMRFLNADGASQCVELMGCFSAAEVQKQAAHVCGCLAKTGHKACIALLEADVGSMLQAHIKQPDTMLCMFESAALIVSAVANSAGEAGHALTQLGLMAHLTGALAAESQAPHSARTAALNAITALCSNQQASVINFLQYGGVNTLLQALLQPERTYDEALAAVTLFESVLARLTECRDLMESVRGMEVLAQVHRDAESREQDALCVVTVSVLAQLTFRHPKNLATLQSDTQLLGNPGLYYEVLAMHERSETSPRQATMFPLFSSSLSGIQTASIHSRESSLSDKDETPPHSARGVFVPGRKSSLDNSSRAFRRMSSSVKGMFGSMRKLMRNQGSEHDEAAQVLTAPPPLPLHSSAPPRDFAHDGSRRLCVA